jgi:antitoxin component YwqK of YwqJK toxin-antitoxin module
MKNKWSYWKIIIGLLAIACAWRAWVWETTKYIYYQDGKISSMYRSYPKILDIINFGNCDSWGHYVNYYENGQPSEEGYYYCDDRRMDGTFTWWAENGRQVDQWRYKNSQPVDGVRLSYYDDGAKKCQMEYKGGLQDGQYILWGQDGRILDQWL